MFLALINFLALAVNESGSLGIGVVFWILFIVGLIFFGVYVARDRATFSVPSLFWWVLIFLLGCGVFGFPIHF